MHLLGVDFGLKRIGIAYCEGLLPSPVTVVAVKTTGQALEEISQIAQKLRAEKLVFGISDGRLDKPTRQFADGLAKKTGLPLSFVDERLTSKEAVTKLVEGGTTKKKRKKMEDAVAAAIILNTYIENLK